MIAPYNLYLVLEQTLIHAGKTDLIVPIQITVMIALYNFYSRIEQTLSNVWMTDPVMFI